MSLKLAQTSFLLAATITTGLMAGLFFAYANSVMPGLHRSSDRTFVEAMIEINKAILNGLFMLCFLGGLLLTTVALALHVPSRRTVLPWIIVGLVLYGVMLLITGAVNVPLNNQLVEAGLPDASTDLAAVRRHFESRWVTWNIVRAILNGAAFAALAWALVLHGRATATTQQSLHPPAVASHTPGLPSPYPPP